MKQGTFEKFDYHPDYGVGGWAGGGYGAAKHDPHPEVLVKLGGIELAGFPKSDISLFYPVKRLVINCTGLSIGRSEKVIKSLPPGWEDLKVEPIEVNELLIDWTDRAALPIKASFWASIWERVYKIGYERVEVCCMGGHGRTGTALCCLLAANEGFQCPASIKDGWDIIKWLREKYCKDAVESMEQIDYVEYVWDYYRGGSK